MKLSVEIGEKHFLFLVGILAVVSAIGIVTGYGTDNPQNFGHSPGEIGPGTFTGSGSDVWSFPGMVESQSGGFKFPDGGMQEKASNLVMKRGYTALVTGITYNGITPVNNYNIPVALPDNTKAVIIGCRYTQGAGAHGYLDFWAYQKGATADEDRTFFYNRHYNDYYNTDYYELFVPWNEGLEDVITINVTYSYNTNGNNQYDIFYAGYIAA